MFAGIPPQEQCIQEVQLQTPIESIKTGNLKIAKLAFVMPHDIRTVTIF